MPDLAQIALFLNAIILPLIGAVALLAAKFSQGEGARWAERQFFGVLLVMTLVTLRTVITCDQVWLVHTTTLGTLIVASLVIPSQGAPVSI